LGIEKKVVNCTMKYFFILLLSLSSIVSMAQTRCDSLLAELTILFRVKDYLITKQEASENRGDYYYFGTQIDTISLQVMDSLVVYGKCFLSKEEQVKFEKRLVEKRVYWKKKLEDDLKQYGRFKEQTN